MHDLRSLNYSEARITDEGIMDVTGSFIAEHRWRHCPGEAKIMSKCKEFITFAHECLAMLTVVVFNGYIGGDLQQYVKDALAKVGLPRDVLPVVTNKESSRPRPWITSSR